MKALIVCIDALRPDAVTEALTPNLYNLSKRAVLFENHHSAFPSDTRPNAATLVSGVNCGRHGVMGNAFRLKLDDGTHELVDTGSSLRIGDIDARLADGLFGVPTLGQILQREGLGYAVVSSASTGTTRLLRHKFHSNSRHVTLHCHDLKASYPQDFASAVAAQFGMPPPVAAPDLVAIDYGITVFLDFIWPRLQPDVSLFWFNEPDVSYHAYGPFAEETQQTLLALDVQIGRLIDWWRDQNPMPLIILSDHGQIDTSEQIDVIKLLQNAGFDAGGIEQKGPDVGVVPGSFVQLYVRTKSKIPDLIIWLEKQAWCGVIFSKYPYQGAFSFSVVGYDHDRAADLAFTFKASPTHSGAETPYFTGKDLRGTHGGLDEMETQAVFMVAPDQTCSGARCDLPTSTCDILPTLLNLLGLPNPAGVSGQSLIDHANGGPAQLTRVRRIVQTRSENRRQVLELSGDAENPVVHWGKAENVD